MYAHYYRPFPKRLRHRITQMQIVQFLLSLVIHSSIYWVYDCDRNVHSHWYEFLTPYVLVGSYLVLFINFYLTQFVWAKLTGKENKGASKSKTQ